MHTLRKSLQVLVLASVVAVLQCFPAEFHPKEKEVKRDYAFSYGVEDEAMGVNFQRDETAEGNTVKGSYSVHLPDGRTQIVTYYADHENGFTADIKYEGEASFPEEEKKEPFVVPYKKGYPQQKPERPQHSFYPSPEAPAFQESPAKPIILEVPEDNTIYQADQEIEELLNEPMNLHNFQDIMENLEPEVLPVSQPEHPAYISEPTEKEFARGQSNSPYYNAKRHYRRPF